MVPPSDSASKAAEFTQTSSLFSIDVLKVGMILLVLLDHSIPHALLFTLGSPFWERVSIPIFLLIFGFNWTHTFDRQFAGTLPSLRACYSKDYLYRKFRRFVVPYCILILIDLLIYGIISLLDLSLPVNFPLESPAYIFLGYTFFWGPGMWFIPVLFGLILLFPFVYYCFIRKPVLTLIGTFLVEEIMRGLLYFLYLDSSNHWTWHISNWFFRVNALSYLFAIGLGMWFAHHPDILSRTNLFLWVFLPIAEIYLIAYTFLGVRFGWLGGDYNFLTYIYSAGLFLGAITLLPCQISSHVLTKWFGLISRATYHILLVQMFYFSFIYHFVTTLDEGFGMNFIPYLWFVPVTVVITFLGGILLYRGHRFWISWVDASPRRQLGIKIEIIISLVFYCWLFVGGTLFFLHNPR